MLKETVNDKALIVVLSKSMQQAGAFILLIILLSFVPLNNDSSLAVSCVPD